MLFTNYPTAGVIKVMQQATQKGYSPDNLNWINFGQGSPETGKIEKDQERLITADLTNSYNYAPVPGNTNLRQKIADFYNNIYRKNNDKKYTAKNVLVTGGGRGGLVKALLTLNSKQNFGYFSPDYTSYTGAMSLMPSFNFTEIAQNPETNFDFDLTEILNQVKEKQISTLLMSNPVNPTGQILEKPELKELVEFFIKNNRMLIHDEYYSRYIYGKDYDFQSATEFVTDPENDPILVIDGLTKSWRYPGFRLGWLVGPKKFINSVTNLSSFLDGGISHPTQNLTEQILDFDKQEFEENTKALQQVFIEKRDILLKAISQTKLKVNKKPDGGFYIFADISALPKPYNIDENFLQLCLDNQMIVVPGSNFDLNPKQLKSEIKFKNKVRFSYGPTKEVIQKGVERLVKVLNSLRSIL